VTKLADESGLVYRKSGERISKSNIHFILTNPIYYGDFNWCGKIFPGIHEPVITKELWDKVQLVLKEKGRNNSGFQKYDWAFQGLLKCGHCGCTLTAELKKGKYIYYHCTGHRGKCPEKYVREEELERQFSLALRAISLDDDVLQWVISALKNSHTDEKRYHDEMISTLQTQYQKTQNRLDAMYLDKLDGRISQSLYDEKSEAWRKDQTDIARKIENHQTANHNYIDEGIRILELAQRAHSLFERQTAVEKRKLLNYVLSNSTWKDGILTPSYRKPFDLIVGMQQKAVDNFAGMSGKFEKEAQIEKWLPD
jgi:site-specific DNA recombinase